MKAWQVALAVAAGAGIALATVALVRASKPTILDIIDNPGKYVDKSVTLVGTVVKPDDYAGLDDGTGVLALNPATSDISNRLVGLLGYRVKVWGTVQQAPDMPNVYYLYTIGVLQA